MTTGKRICETSLRWVLAMRQHKRIHNCDMRNLSIKEHPEVFGGIGTATCPNFGHSGGSLKWTCYEAQKIDEIGLGNWLKTDAAYGYTGSPFKEYD